MNLREFVSQDRIKKGLYWQRAWSLVEGCNPVSEGCENCWAATQAHMRAGQKGKIADRYKSLTTDNGKWNGQIKLLEENLELPLKIKKPTLFSIWNDLFHPKVPDAFILAALGNMTLVDHFFLLLTKRIDRALSFLQKPQVIEKWYGKKRNLRIMPLPSNCGIGTTIELSKYLHRIEALLKIQAILHFISLEPLLEELSIAGYSWKNSTPDENRIGWVIVGCESGSKRRPMKTKWITKIINECKRAKVPLFMKQEEVCGKLIHAPASHLLQFPNVEF